jgi:hypothetical protein
MRASQGEVLRNRITNASVDAWGHARRELFVKVFTSSHLTELLLFLWRELLPERVQSLSACGRGRDLKVSDPEIWGAQRRGRFLYVGQRMVLEVGTLPTFLTDWKVEYMPVAITLEPGTTLPVKYRSADKSMCLGSSPTGTMSGASWSFNVW